MVAFFPWFSRLVFVFVLSCLVFFVDLLLPPPYALHVFSFCLSYSLSSLQRCLSEGELSLSPHAAHPSSGVPHQTHTFHMRPLPPFSHSPRARCHGPPTERGDRGGTATPPFSFCRLSHLKPFFFIPPPRLSIRSFLVLTTIYLFL